MAAKHLIQTFEVGTGTRSLLILGGWKTRAWMYWPVARMMAIGGYRAVVFAYRDDVFSTDVSATLANITGVCDAVNRKIEELRGEGCSEISILGFSLGNLIALMVADRSEQVTNLILDLAGSHPAEAVWAWDKINPVFKNAILDQHLSLADLKKIWDPIASINNISNLQGKRILVYLAAHDQVIPYSQGMALVEKMRTADYNVRLELNQHGGHALAGTLNLLKFRRNLEFLRNHKQSTGDGELRGKSR